MHPIFSVLTCYTLFRNRSASSEEEPPAFEIVPGLEAKVAERGYRLRFVAGTECVPCTTLPFSSSLTFVIRRDCLYRRGPKAPVEEEAEDAPPVGQRRRERFERWLHLQLHPEEAEAEAAAAAAPEAEGELESAAGDDEGVEPAGEEDAASEKAASVQPAAEASAGAGGDAVMEEA